MPGRSLTACFELVTPAFASGALPEKFAELRVEAIVGQLRRWWWAQAPLHTCNGGFDLDKAKAFADALFGAAGSDESGSNAKKGQGAFLITLCKSSVVPRKKSAGLEDLFGPLWGNRDQWLWKSSPTASALPHFEVSFLMRPKRPERDKFNDEDLVEGLFRALALWGLLGGLGAAQRRGFGSVRLTKIADKGDNCGPTQTWSAPDTKDEFVARLEERLPAMGSGTGPFDFGAFGAATEGTPKAAIWMAEVPNCNDGPHALGCIQSALLSVWGHLPNKGKMKFPIDLMSIQSEGGGRSPSRFHFHVSQFGSSIAVILSVLPVNAPNLADYGEVAAERNADVRRLVDQLGMQRVLPPDSGPTP
jgi:hypothetical protein